MIINEVLDTVTSIAKGVIGLGLSLVTVALVVDVLFPCLLYTSDAADE